MAYVDRYDPDEDFDRWYTDATSRSIGRWLRAGDTVLELGCATGRMSTRSQTGVQRSPALTTPPRTSIGLGPEVWLATFLEADIVAVDLGTTFDHVVMTNVVHEVAEPAALFATAAHHVAPVAMSTCRSRTPPRSIGWWAGRWG